VNRNMDKMKTYALTAWVLVAIVLGATWAQNSSSAGVSVTANSSSIAVITLWPTESQRPSWAPIEGTVGSVTAGKLFNFTVPDTGRYMVTLFLTDVNELVQAYSYLNLNVTIVQATSAWTESTQETSDWLTLTNGHVVLYVDGNTRYIVKIAQGVYYCTESSNQDNLSPEFYIKIDQA